MTNGKVKASEIATELQVFAGSTENIVHKHLRTKEYCLLSNFLVSTH